MQPMGPKKSAAATKAAPKATRRYTNTRRTAQAAQTRADVLASAIELFAEQGWAPTTIAAIAEHAGVAVETIYSGFGSKKKLLQQAVDVTVVGDAEPIPYFDRPEVQALATGERTDRFVRGIRTVTASNQRGARLWRACIEAAAGDEEMERWRLEKLAGRRLDTFRVLELILDIELDPVTIEMLMVLYSPETWLFLVEDSGWTIEQYETELLSASLAIIRLRHPEL